jgi:molecular chaperone DnaK
MVKDAEAHADEDRKARELVEARNQCDALIHAVKKSLTEHGDKISADEKSRIEAAIKAAEEAIKGDDKDAIEARSKDLAEASHKLAEKIYSQQQTQNGGSQPQPESGGAKSEDGNVVDAEFEEVKDQKKSA